MPDQPRDADGTPDDLTGPLMLTPRRPDQVPRGREMPTLLDDFHHVYWQLLQQRRGLADPVPNEHLIPIGLAELALGAALIEGLRSIRWHTVADVLGAGGSPIECTAALGLHPPANLRACWRTDHGSLTSPVPRIRKIMVASGVSRRA